MLEDFDRVLGPLARKLRNVGIGTTDHLTSHNARELGLRRGIGPATITAVVEQLARAGLELAKDPYAAYVCARHSEPARDAELRAFFLCDACRHSYTTLAFSSREPEWVSSESVDGFCGHCNDHREVRLTQWFLCGTCDRVTRSIGRGLASATYVETQWELSVERSTNLRLQETDPVLLQPRGRRSDPNRHPTPDFVATWESDQAALGLELKSGRSPLPGGGIGNPMSQFQLDTTDCDDIEAAVQTISAPVFLIHAQIIGRAYAPTERYVGVGLWYARPWDLLPNLEAVRRRPRETRDAAYFKTAAFHPFSDFSRYVEEDYGDDLDLMRRSGFPALYRR